MNSSLVTRHSSLAARHSPFAAALLAAVLALSCGALGAALTGCTTPVNQRVVAGQTIKAAGQAAEAALTLSAQLYAAGRISPAVARGHLDFFDQRWQPAYRVALAAVASDTGAPAPAQLLALLAQFQAMIPPPAPAQP